MPYLLDRQNPEGSSGNDLLKTVAPLAGAGVATLPFVLNQRRDKPTGRSHAAPKVKNGWLVPDAYLKYTLYNNEGVLIKSETQTIDRGAKNAWQRLALRQEVNQNGFVQIELGNDSKRAVRFEQIMVRTQHRQPPEGVPLDSLLYSNSEGDGAPSCELVCVYTPSSTHCYQDCSDPSDDYNPCEYDPNREYCECMQYADTDVCDCDILGMCDEEDPCEDYGDCEDDYDDYDEGGGDQDEGWGTNKKEPEVVVGRCHGINKMLDLQNLHQKEQVGLLTRNGEVILLPWDGNSKYLSSTFNRYKNQQGQVTLSIYTEGGKWYATTADYSKGTPVFTEHEIAAHFHTHPHNDLPSPADKSFASSGSPFEGMPAYYIVTEKRITQYNSKGKLSSSRNNCL